VNLIVGWCGQFLIPDWTYFYCPGTTLVGDIMVHGSFGNMPTLLLMRNMLYAPGLTNNLLSGIMLMEADPKGKLLESCLGLYDQTSGGAVSENKLSERFVEISVKTFLY